MNSDARANAKRIMGEDLAERYPMGSGYIYKPTGTPVRVTGINEKFPLGKGGYTRRVLVAPVGSPKQKIHASPSNLEPATPEQLQGAIPKIRLQLG